MSLLAQKTEQEREHFGLGAAGRGLIDPHVDAEGSVGTS